MPEKLSDSRQTAGQGKWPKAPFEGSDGSENWISLHTFHAGDIDRLIVGAVHPLVTTRLGEGRLREFFFLRYWEGGPHLRLRLLPNDMADSPAVHSLAVAELTRYLAEHPSPARRPTHEYAAIAARLALAEGRVDHDRYIRQTDCVESIHYQPEYEVYGGPVAVRAAERHFTVSSRIALRLVVANASMEQRAGVALAALVSALAVWEPDLTRVGRLLAASRDHWDRPRHAWHYESQRRVLLERVQRQWRRATAGAGLPDRGPATEWLRSISRLRSELAGLHLIDRFAPAASSSPFTPSEIDIPADRRGILFVLLRCVHLLHNRLGLTSAREAYLRYLVGGTIIDLAKGGH